MTAETRERLCELRRDLQEKEDQYAAIFTDASNSGALSMLYREILLVRARLEAEETEQIRRTIPAS
ncbi:MAG: hypothetical protein JWP27_1021 [Flaviaesturariibacter sp.]|nr:hypothetical protein [Flaviaesturariibacter sp.]